MGCSTSKEVKNFIAELEKHDYFSILIDFNWNPSYLYDIYTLYVILHPDPSKSMNINDIFALFDIEKTSFNLKLWSLFDVNQTGKLNFYEFVITLWNYCTIDESMICK